MDGATTAVIILVFVFSIFGAVTNKKEENAKINRSPAAVSQPELVYSGVDVEKVPAEFFAAGYVDGLTERIKGFILSYGRGVSDGDAASISENIVRYSRQYDTNPRLVTAIIARESRFNKFAVSSSGAQGLGQLLPSTSVGLGISDPFDIEQNVKGSVRYFKSMLDRFPPPNKVTYAIAGYFEGPNAVQRNSGFKSKSKNYIEDILNIYTKI